MYPALSIAELAISRGAAAFVPKSASFVELQSAIAEAMEGRTYVSSRVSGPMGGRSNHDLEDFALLAPREQIVVQLIGRGLSSDQIAHLIGIGCRGVHFHRTNVRRKLRLHTDVDMLRFAINIALVDEL
jgi:DNA-binding NarL/FixJ family response regulator